MGDTNEAVEVGFLLAGEPAGDGGLLEVEDGSNLSLWQAGVPQGLDNLDARVCAHGESIIH